MKDDIYLELLHEGTVLHTLSSKDVNMKTVEKGLQLRGALSADFLCALEKTSVIAVNMISHKNNVILSAMMGDLYSYKIDFTVVNGYCEMKVDLGLCYE